MNASERKGPKNIQESHFRSMRDDELYLNTFFEVCRKFGVRWTKATQKEKDFVTEMTRVTVQNRLGYPQDKIHFFGE